MNRSVRLVPHRSPAGGRALRRLRRKRSPTVLSAARRRLAALVTVPFIALLAVGCGEVREQTQWSDDRTHGVSANAGDVAIRNALVVADENGSEATMFAVFANRGPADELVSVRVGDTEAEPEGGPLEIPARGYAALGPDNTRLDVTGVELTPGLRVEVEFIFGSAPRATVSALVKPAEGIYAGALE